MLSAAFMADTTAATYSVAVYVRFGPMFAVQVLDPSVQSMLRLSTPTSNASPPRYIPGTEPSPKAAPKESIGWGVSAAVRGISGDDRLPAAATTPAAWKRLG